MPSQALGELYHSRHVSIGAAVLRQLAAEGLSKARIARLLGIGRASFHQMLTADAITLADPFSAP